MALFGKDSKITKVPVPKEYGAHAHDENGNHIETEIVTKREPGFFKKVGLVFDAIATNQLGLQNRPNPFDDYSRIPVQQQNTDPREQEDFSDIKYIDRVTLNDGIYMLPEPIFGPFTSRDQINFEILRCLADRYHWEKVPEEENEEE